MLTTLRNHSQSWVIKVMLGMIVLTFVVSFGIGTFSRTKQVVARLGEQEILAQEFNETYQQELQRLRNRYPEEADQLAQQLGLRRRVLDRMINRRLLLKAARAQGFSVPTDELQQTITSRQAFQVDGKFDFPTYRSVLQRNGFSPESFEARMRQDLLIDKYRRNLLQGVTVSRQEVEQRFRMENEEVTVAYLDVSPQRFRSQVSVGEEDLQAYYEEHQQAFMQPAQFRVEYFTLSLDTLLPRVGIPEKAVSRYYERHKAREFSTSQRVRARHILKRVGPDAGKEKTQQVRQEMERILERIRGGADFAEIARQHSEDRTAEKGGDLGYFREGEMVQAFEKAAFALEPGQVSGVVRSPFGFHIIKVVDTEPGTEQPFSQVKEEIRQRLLERRAERKLELEAERLPQRIQEQGIEQVAGSLPVEVQQTPWFDGSRDLEGLGAAKPLYDLLQSKRSGDAGVWRRNPVQGHLFYQVTGRKEAFPKPLEQVRAEVRQRVLKNESLAAAEEAARNAVDNLSRDGAELEAYARRWELELRSVAFTLQSDSSPVSDIPRDFRRTAFSLTEERPFGVSARDGKVFLLRLQSRGVPNIDDAGTRRQELARQLRSEWQGYFMQKEQQRLREKHQVEIVAPEYLSGA